MSGQGRVRENWDAWAFVVKLEWPDSFRKANVELPHDKLPLKDW